MAPSRSTTDANKTAGPAPKRQKTSVKLDSDPFPCPFAHKYPFAFPKCIPHPDKPKNGGQPVANSFLRICDLLQHLARSHPAVLQCERCFAVFPGTQEGERQRTEHYRANGCSQGTQRRHIAMTIVQQHEIRAALKEARKGKKGKKGKKGPEVSDLDRWNWICRTLFGENEDTNPMPPVANPKTYLHDAMANLLESFKQNEGNSNADYQTVERFLQYAKSKWPPCPDFIPIPATGPTVTAPVGQSTPEQFKQISQLLADDHVDHTDRPSPAASLGGTSNRWDFKDKGDEFWGDNYGSSTQQNSALAVAGPSNSRWGVTPSIQDFSPMSRQESEFPVDPGLEDMFTNHDDDESDTVIVANPEPS